MEFYIKGKSFPNIGSYIKMFVGILTKALISNSEECSSFPQVTQVLIDLYQTIYPSTLQMDSGKINIFSHLGFVWNEIHLWREITKKTMYLSKHIPVLPPILWEMLSPCVLFLPTLFHFFTKNFNLGKKTNLYKH